MVVGNPPWSTGTKLPEWSMVLSTVARIASERTGAKIAPPLPNEALDLPFIWRAMEWAKPGGQIASLVFNGRVSRKARRSFVGTSAATRARSAAGIHILNPIIAPISANFAWILMDWRASGGLTAADCSGSSSSSSVGTTTVTSPTGVLIFRSFSHLALRSEL